MSLRGMNFIGFSESGANKETFRAFDPTLNKVMEEDFFKASEDEFSRALGMANDAFKIFREHSAASRAAFLRGIAEEIMASGEALIERCSSETGLPSGRIIGERARTCAQLNLFASLLLDGWWADPRIDTAQPSRSPVPKPDVRRMLIPLGPVAVFGSSNFPLAFSTAGGDTASALAAGCPVIVKAHSSHPGTNEIVSSAIVRAARKTGMPEGVFSSLYLSHEMSLKLVQHPVIKAVGFTGSRKVGMMLFNAGAQRKEPIPVYAEMSAVNPVIIFEGALKEKSDQIASGLVESITLGAGQFCTNPGLVFVKEDNTTQRFLDSVADNIAKTRPGTMLNPNICRSYSEGVATLEKEKAVRVLARASVEASVNGHEARPVVFVVNAAEFARNWQLSQEVFGPASLIVTYTQTAELISMLEAMEGQLTATIHAGAGDEEVLQDIVRIVSHKAGRILFGGYPTGVEVCHSMQHGGPFPSTTDSRSTSVGTAAIYRFLRPVAYQNFPDNLLPEALQNKNPLNILRLVDGQWTKDQVGNAV